MGVVMKNRFDIEGNVCVITGAGGALGGHLATQLAASGARVALLDVQGEAVHQLAERLRSEGYAAQAYQCSVLDTDQLEQVRDAIHNEFGAVDSLINAAGGNVPSGTSDCEFYDERAERSFLDLDRNGMRKTFDLNYFGTVYPSQVFSRDLLEKKKGSIINFGSVSSINPLSKVVSYSSAKAAVVNFTKWLAVHYSHHNVRVNALAPGFVMTEQLRFLHVKEDGSYTDRAKAVLAHTPMNRYAEPDELTGAVIWLLSDASSFVTGSLITIDGGFSSYTI